LAAPSYLGPGYPLQVRPPQPHALRAFHSYPWPVALMVLAKTISSFIKKRSPLRKKNIILHKKGTSLRKKSIILHKKNIILQKKDHPSLKRYYPAAKNIIGPSSAKLESHWTTRRNYDQRF
jgi:hypothetical protein